MLTLMNREFHKAIMKAFTEQQMLGFACPETDKFDAGRNIDWHRDKNRRFNKLRI